MPIILNPIIFKVSKLSLSKLYQSIQITNGTFVQLFVSIIEKTHGTLLNIQSQFLEFIKGELAFSPDKVLLVLSPRSWGMQEQFKRINYIRKAIIFKQYLLNRNTNSITIRIQN
jgi:hypothetical protein